MNSRQRVLAAFERRGYDRIPVDPEATPELNKMPMEHFGLSKWIPREATPARANAVHKHGR